MKYLSTFSGIGGFEIGINKAYEDYFSNKKQMPEQEGLSYPRDSLHPTSKRDRKDWDKYPTCVGYSEINKYADQIYKSKFPEHKNYGDITKINEKELPDFDLFVGGFPCQAFSIAGKRGGFDDTRGTLFFDCARILKEKQPRNFILENVKGLLSHDNGRTFKTIINTLTELGYCVEWQVLNAKNFGVPQNRERVFIVGHLGGIPKRKVFPITGADTKTNGVLQIGKRLDSNSGTQPFQQDRVYDIKGISPALQQALPEGSHKIQIADYRNDEGLRIRSEPISPCLSARRTSDTDLSTMTNLIIKPETLIRRLTPLECERLMAYPDGWTEGLSDTQRYKTLGNGIVSNVVAEVVKRLYN